MRTIKKSFVSVLLALVLLATCVLPVAAAGYEYTLSSIDLKLGANPVTVAANSTTIVKFKPSAVGYYRVTVDNPDATVNFWYGTAQYVSMPAEDSGEGDLIVTCTAVGQRLLIGISGVSSATITVAYEPGYVAPPQVVYQTYKNVHSPSWWFSMPSDPLTSVDITKKQTVVADSKGIYHLGNVNGPILYVNLRASRFTDLYKLYYPDDVEGEEWPPVDTLRGRYEERNNKIYCYDFVDAMADYADALTDDGYYYLTVDLANFIQMYGRDQGWFVPRYSPFAAIQEGNFIEESAWLVNAYYVAPDVERGDVNGDGNINNRDLARMQQYLNDWDVTVEMAGADLNGDGKVTNRDLGQLQKLLNEYN